jgi:hypothetical protein
MMRLSNSVLSVGAGIVCLILSCFVCQTRADNIQTLTDNNSSVSIDLSSQAGMYNWSVDGNNYLAQQWFWYRIGSGSAQSSIDTLTLGAVTNTGGSLLTTYFGTGFNIGLDLVLAGGSSGSGVSGMTETITINNTSGSSLPLSFFQFSHFILGGVNTVTLSGFHAGTLYDAYQTGDGGSVVGETDVTPSANEGETAIYPSTLTALNTTPGYTLDGNTNSTGNVTWAFEWDKNLAPGGSLEISKTLSLTVPEPSTVALLSVGLAAWAWRRQRRN